MTNCMDIWRAAKLLVDHHETNAPIRAAQRADEPLAAGNVERRALWLRILTAVEKLMATTLLGQAHGSTGRHATVVIVA